MVVGTVSLRVCDVSEGDNRSRRYGVSTGIRNHSITSGRVGSRADALPLATAVVTAFIGRSASGDLSLCNGSGGKESAGGSCFRTHCWCEGNASIVVPSVAAVRCATCIATARSAAGDAMTTTSASVVPGNHMTQLQ